MKSELVHKQPLSVGAGCFVSVQSWFKFPQSLHVLFVAPAMVKQTWCAAPLGSEAQSQSTGRHAGLLLDDARTDGLALGDTEGDKDELLTDDDGEASGEGLAGAEGAAGDDGAADGAADDNADGASDGETESDGDTLEARADDGAAGGLDTGTTDDSMTADDGDDKADTLDDDRDDKETDDREKDDEETLDGTGDALGIDTADEVTEGAGEADGNGGNGAGATQQRRPMTTNGIP